jgi:uncharacterized protein YciI
MRKERAMSQQTPPARYLVLFSRGRNWREGALFNEQPEAGSHSEYMASKRCSGQLLRGVPLTDGSGSIALLQVQNMEEALQLIEGDPMVSAGIMHADLYEWKAAFER